MGVTVTLSKKNQIVIPREARQKLSLKPGAKLLVLSKADRIVMIPQPVDYVEETAGLHREVWSAMDGDAYLEEERNSWD